MSMTSVAGAARAAVKAGLCVVPPREDGSKRPNGEWKLYTVERPAKAVLQTWFGPCSGLGVVAGKVSGNLEVFEFDDAQTYRVFCEVAKATGLREVVERLEAGYVEDTPNGGVHWLYRCDTLAGNLKLATRPKGDGTHATLIETRGEGGYCILAPSHGAVHPTGKPYVLRAGGFETIPTLTPDERAQLHGLAKTFDEQPAKPATAERVAVAQKQPGTRPGDQFAAATSWAAILEPSGWSLVYERAGVGYWCRPGKAKGISATTNYGGSDYLIVFSSSTPFETGRGYGKFSAYAILNFAGDFAEAAVTLADRGYGESAPVAPEAPTTVEPVRQAFQTTAIHIKEVLHELGAAMDAGPPRCVPTPFGELNFLCNGGFAAGELVFIGARPGVGKTALALELARHAARRDSVLFISREMVRLALVRRLVAQDAKISASDLRRHTLRPIDGHDYATSEQRLSELSLYLTDQVSSLTEIRQLMEHPPDDEPWGLVIVDYLQLVRAPKDIKERRLQVEAVSLGLKAIALKYRIPVVCLTSLRRPQQGNPRPTNADLRESGELEHDADIILLLHKPDEDASVVEAHISKNRDGETGTRNLLFDKRTVSFMEEQRPGREQRT